MDNSTPKKANVYTIILIAILVAIPVLVLSIKTISQKSAQNPDSSATSTPETEPDQQFSQEDYPTIYNSIIPARPDNGNIADHVRGKADSKIIVIEYADFQCPGCANFMPHMTSLYHDYQDQVAFVFRNLPIAGHQNAKPAARAAEAAGLQGYYWEMAEALFAQRDSWVGLSDGQLTIAFVDIFKSVAPKGDVQKFRSDLTNKNIDTKISFDYTLGVNYAKVSATPTVYVNGKDISDKANGQSSLDNYINNLKTEIEAQLAE